MVQPSWISLIDINVTKPKLEEHKSLVPNCRMIFSMHYCCSIRGTWPRWRQHDDGLLYARGLMRVGRNVRVLWQWRAVTFHSVFDSLFVNNAPLHSSYVSIHSFNIKPSKATPKANSFAPDPQIRKRVYSSYLINSPTW